MFRKVFEDFVTYINCMYERCAVWIQFMYQKYPHRMIAVGTSAASMCMLIIAVCGVTLLTSSYAPTADAVSPESQGKDESVEPLTATDEVTVANPSVSSNAATIQTEPVEDRVSPVVGNASCNANYSPCIADSSSDLNCTDIRMEVTVTGSDVYKLDRDGDGYGCESYR